MEGRAAPEIRQNLSFPFILFHSQSPAKRFPLFGDPEERGHHVVNESLFCIHADYAWGASSSRLPPCLHLFRNQWLQCLSPRQFQKPVGRG